MAGRREGAIAVLAHLVGTDKKTYGRWLTLEAVHGPRGADDVPTDLDAIEVGALHALVDRLGDADGRIAWNQVGERMLKMEPVDEIRVVWREPYEAILCLTDKEVGAAASAAGRRVNVVQVGAAALEARRQLRLRAKGLHLRP